MAFIFDNLRVLLIEDEILVAEPLKWFLEDAAIRVVGPFVTLTEALSAAVTDEFDLGLVDLNLKGEAAYPVADTLANRGIPFILMSGYARQDLPIKYARYPSLTKPFEPQALLEMIEKVAAAATPPCSPRA